MSATTAAISSEYPRRDKITSHHADAARNLAGNPVGPFLDPFQYRAPMPDGCNTKYNNYYYYKHYLRVDRINRKPYIHARTPSSLLYIFINFFFSWHRTQTVYLPATALCIIRVYNTTRWLIHPVHGTLYDIIILIFPTTAAVVPLAHDSACAKQSVFYCRRPFPNSRHPRIFSATSFARFTRPIPHPNSCRVPQNRSVNIVVVVLSGLTS